LLAEIFKIADSNLRVSATISFDTKTSYYLLFNNLGLYMVLTEYDQPVIV